MNGPGLAQFVVHLRIMLLRLSWLNLGVGLLFLAPVVVWLTVVPHLSQQLTMQHEAVLLAQKALAVPKTSVTPPARPLAEVRLQEFYAVLGDDHYAEQQVKTLFALAAKDGLNLSQADYQRTADKNGRFHMYRIVLPVKGSYPAIRHFCEQMLQTLPFAALDEMSFKRDAVGNAVIETRVVFTLYLASGDIPGPRRERS
jgi:hypothetical protein